MEWIHSTFPTKQTLKVATNRTHGNPVVIKTIPEKGIKKREKKITRYGLKRTVLEKCMDKPKNEAWVWLWAIRFLDKMDCCSNAFAGGWCVEVADTLHGCSISDHWEERSVTNRVPWLWASQGEECGAFYSCRWHGGVYDLGCTWRSKIHVLFRRAVGQAVWSSQGGSGEAADGVRIF